MLGLLTIAAAALVRGHFQLRQDFSDFKLKVSDNYANTADIAKIENTIGAIQAELKSILEILFELRADLRAGNLIDRTRHG
jgi:hypothetical protein